MSAQPIPRISPEEYLRLDRAAEVKSEYYDGEMFAMSGGSVAHANLPLRLAASLLDQLDSNGCTIASSDLRVRISPCGPFVYPDLTICCGEPELADDYSDTLLNPTVVIEVLSKSSEAYDRGQKFAQYRRIESLRDYVLISQDEPRIEVFARTPTGSWNMTEFVGMDAVASIQSIGCTVRLATIYRGASSIKSV